MLVAIDGDEGFQLFTKYKPDLVIADIKMNKMNGLEMIEKIRQSNNRVQIIVTTAFDDSEYLLQSLGQHVNHFILKPIDLEKIPTCDPKIHLSNTTRKGTFQTKKVNEDHDGFTR